MSSRDRDRLQLDRAARWVRTHDRGGPAERRLVQTCQGRVFALDFPLMEEVTPNEIARQLGVTGLTFRNWLRAERAAGHPLLADHEYRSHYAFTRAEADLLEAEFRARDGRERASGQSHAATAVRATRRLPPAVARKEPPGGVQAADAVPPGRSRATASLTTHPPLPTAFTRAALAAVGFRGFVTWPHLSETGYSSVPSSPGAYVVLRVATTPPVWLHPGTGGVFKGKDPNVSQDRLNAEWVPGAQTVYVGKADARKARRPGQRDGLDARLSEYGRFGAGEPIGHSGGRLIWQLADADDLLVAWQVIDWQETAAAYETRLLDHFIAEHGCLPFANLRR